MFTFRTIPSAVQCVYQNFLSATSAVAPEFTSLIQIINITYSEPLPSRINLKSTLTSQQHPRPPFLDSHGFADTECSALVVVLKYKQALCKPYPAGAIFAFCSIMAIFRQMWNNSPCGAYYLTTLIAWIHQTD